MAKRKLSKYNKHMKVCLSRNMKKGQSASKRKAVFKSCAAEYRKKKRK